MALDGRLDVSDTPDGVTFAFTVTNTADEPRQLNFRSGLAADFAVSTNDTEIWRWSAGRGFTQALWSDTLSPGESNAFEATWEAPQPGDYTVVATLEAHNADVEAGAEFTVD